MHRRFILAGAGSLLLAGGARGAPADPVAAAAAALGVRAADSLRFVGSGASFTVGQNFTPDDPWPRVALRRFAALMDYRTGAMRVELLRELGPRMPRGGGVPFTGLLQQVEAVGGGYAWNEPVRAAAPGGTGPATPDTSPEAGSTPWAGPNGSPQPAPAPESLVERLLFLWSTPHGFLRAAAASHATARPVNGGTEVAFFVLGRHPVRGLLNARHELVRVETRAEQSLVGDMPIVTEYAGYRSFGAIRFPTRIAQKQDGFPSLELDVSDVAVNPPTGIVSPADVRQHPAGPAVAAQAQKVADGVWFINGGTHHSLAVEMKDHIVLVDTPNGEQRALAVMDKAREVIPGKPIRYVVAMHHHWDHLGGIRTAIAQGATVVTHRSNRALLERIAAAPHTLKPDRLALARVPLKLRTVDAEDQLTDGVRTVRLCTMTGFDHCADMLLVYLPRERVLAEADAYTPPRTPTTPLIAPQVAYAQALVENVRRLKLDVGTVVPFHGARTVEWSEVVQHARAA